MRSDSPGLSSLIAAFGVAAGFVVVAVLARAHLATLPGEPPPPAGLVALAAAAPWEPGAPLPIVRVLDPRARVAVEEDALTGAVVVAEAPVPVEPETRSEPVAASPKAVQTNSPKPTIPSRPPTVPTALLDAGHRGMAPFYTALARRSGLARAAHYGDSTIAADGITGTVRRRLQARFGDGGPGWVDAGLDPQWSARPDLTTRRTGEWETHSILLGGGRGRYGYGGVVSTAPAGGKLVVSRKEEGGAPFTHLELWFGRGPGQGSVWLAADGVEVGSVATVDDARRDDRLVVDAPASRVGFGATGGPVPLYGVVLEAAGPGVVWDALGVVGVGTRSFTYFDKDHLAAQVSTRQPDLVVVMLGGNELGVPALQHGDGGGYEPGYLTTLRMLRAGAPAAGCLLITPLDQGTREGARPGTKPSLRRLVEVERRVAAAEGCAFWDAFAAMGGEGSIVAWGKKRPPLAWTDLLHLSAAGQDLVGQALADAIEAGFDAWSKEQSAEKP